MNTELQERSTVDEKLDAVEERLPALPAAVFRLQRTVAERTLSSVGDAAGAVKGSMCAANRAAATALKTVTGTAEWVANRTFNTASTGTKTLVGQTKAQAKIAGDAVVEEINDLADSAADSAENASEAITDAVNATEAELDETPVGSGPYESWTKEELYARAQELDIDGRSTMTKDDLVVALRAA